MRKEPVKVVIWGFGAMGSGMAKMILNKQGFDIVGVCDLNPNRVGKSIFELLNLKNPYHHDVIIKANIDEVVSMRSCDVVLLATDSFTAKAFPKIVWLLEHQVNVISTAEEMAYPYASQPQISFEIDKVAKENGVSVLGTGINPGMMMDLLVVAMTGVMEDVDQIDVTRINSLSPFGSTVMEEQGVGLSVEEFNEKMNQGELAGHVGFKESVQMISDALGWKIEHFEQHMAPIISKVYRKSEYAFVNSGDVAGVNMSAEAKTTNQKIITMNHPQQIEPHLGGVNTGDYIKIKGNPPINLAISPEVDGGIGTIAICVNMIPHIINARCGLKTMLDLPVPRAIMGDVRQMIE